MRLAAALIALAGCGRHSFNNNVDAAVVVADDAAVDAMIADADTRLPGLLAWYRMEDAFGDGKLTDDGGSSRAAQCVVSLTCPTQVTGPRGKAAAFDGTQYARITYGTWMNTPAGYSIAAWIYLDTQVDQVAFGKPYGDAALDSWGITTWSPIGSNGTCMETVDGAMGTEWVCGPTLPAGQWFHVVGRWTGGSKALFIDGVKVAEVTTAPASLLDIHDVIIGGDENAGSPAFLFNGKVDELQLYGRGLSDDEIGMLATP